MDILTYNFSWMLFNLYLAFLPILFCWLFFRVKNKIGKAIFGILWFLYLPNSIYVFTDLHHLVEQWDFVGGNEKIILVVQYVIFEIIGLTAFLLGFSPLEKFFARPMIIFINFLFGFAMVLGKFERINSWEVFSNPRGVINGVINIVSSVEMMGLVFLFGSFSTLFYFLFRRFLPQKRRSVLPRKKN